MKYGILLGTVIFAQTVFAQQQISSKLTTSKEYRNKNLVVSINNRPIDFYLNHSKIDLDSKRFFKGEVSLTKDNLLKGLLDSLFTNNIETQPFYFFVFNQIVDLSDNDLAGIIAPKCIEFLRVRPCYFLNAFNQPEININVVKWTTYIGQTLKERSQYIDFKSTVDNSIRRECSEANDLWKSFAAEVRMCLVR